MKRTWHRQEELALTLWYVLGFDGFTIGQQVRIGMVMYDYGIPLRVRL
jgi:hypothetical protein